MLRIKLVKSPIAQTPKNRATVRGLGLKKMHQVVLQPDNPAIRGMIHHVKHMLTVEVVEGEAPSKKGKAPKAAAAVVEAPKPKATKPKAAPTKAEAVVEASAETATEEAPKPKRAKKTADAEKVEE